jgi:predicted DsbA family dithiol-disulfide isomerase
MIASPDGVIVVMRGTCQTHSSPGHSKAESYLAMFGGDKNRLKQMTDKMAGTFAGEGLKYNFAGNVSNTLDAHRLLEYTKQHHGPVLQNQLHRALFKMYHSEARDPGDLAMLCEAAASVGLDAGELW